MLCSILEMPEMQSLFFEKQQEQLQEQPLLGL